MSKKIEEIFNLPSANDVEDSDDYDVPQVTDEETGFDLAKMQDTLDTADKIDQALPAVKGLELLDTDMDNYAEEAMRAFKDLMDLGNNVEDRHAAAVFDVAGKMMTNAITAKTAKMDKKLKMIEMQMRKRKLDLEEKKVELQIAKMNADNSDDNTFEGEAQEFDRNSIINEVFNRMKENKGS